MKAAVFTEVGTPLAVEQVPDPAPAPSELVVKVGYGGVADFFNTFGKFAN